MMHRKWLIISLVVAAVIIGSLIVLWQKDKTIEFKNETYGISFSISDGYQKVTREDKQPSESNKLVAHFVRTDPSALITVRYETGLRKVKSFTRRSSIEHFMADISQFFPIKYDGYQFGTLEKHEVKGQEFVEHIFSYKDKDDTIRVRLLLYPYLDDAAYYLMIQSKEADFDKVAKDLDPVANSLVLSGPKN